MRARLTPGWIVLLATACVVPKLVGEGPDTEGDVEGDTEDPTATGSASGPSATASATDDGAEADTGDGSDGLYVDCAMLGPGEPTVGPGAPGPLGFPIFACNPRSSGVSDSGHACCSTDPATGDGQLPAFQGKGITGSTPLYAGAANDAGTWGMCVKIPDIPPDFGLLEEAAANCPIPCNPTWSANDITNVCGQDRVCCQTNELRPKDCVRDESGTWRAVTGADIGSGLVEPVTNWSTVSHETHQDPNGTVCDAFADGDETAFAECIRHLGVADQRGFCMGFGSQSSCPAADPNYIDACEAMNG